MGGPVAFKTEFRLSRQYDGVLGVCNVRNDVILNAVVILHYDPTRKRISRKNQRDFKNEFEDSFCKRDPWCAGEASVSRVQEC